MLSSYRLIPILWIGLLSFYQSGNLGIKYANPFSVLVKLEKYRKGTILNSFFAELKSEFFSYFFCKSSSPVSSPLLPLWAGDLVDKRTDSTSLYLPLFISDKK